MARYTGPTIKLERRENYSLFGSNKYQKRPGNPGQHPTSKSRPSEYAVQIREKQKVKRIYGVLEKQFRLVVKNALKSKGNSGTRLLQILETRLDNVVYRMGFAKTRMQARQFVSHAHVKVNGERINIPSFQVTPGDVVSIDKKIADGDMVKVTTISNTTTNAEFKAPSWLTVSNAEAKIIDLPARAEMDQGINERLIIEFYSR